jgi:hypothetical protein
MEEYMKAVLLRFVAGFAFLLMPAVAFGQIRYYLPQFVDGNFGLLYKTSVIFFNNSDATVTATLRLTNNTGGPLSARFAGLGSGSQFSITLDPGITRIYQSDGSSAGQGAATVSATGPIGVSAIFTVSDSTGKFISEAGVGASPALTDFVLPVDSTGSALTGLALFNPGTADASLTLTLFNADGSLAGTMPAALAKESHMAAFVGLNLAGQFFPSIGNFRGTMRVQSSAAISAVVLRQYQTSATTCFTSLPVVPRSSSKTSLNLAHAANGSYGSITFRTSFLVFNLSSSAADVTLALTDDNGAPFSVNIPGSGVGTGSGSNRKFTLQPNQSVFLQTDGAGTGASGAATITSTVPVGASAIFTVYNSSGFQTEAGVGDSTALSGLTLPVDISGLNDTGIAFFNPGSSAVTLTFKLSDEAGALKGTATRTVAAKGHLATFVDNIFIGTSNFRGSLAVSAPTGFTSTVLRQYNNGANYTTLPAASGVVTGKAGPSSFIVAARALTQTGMGIGQASTVLQSQLQMVLAKYLGGNSCAPLEGGGSVLAGVSTVGVYYDAACRKPYVLATPTFNNRANGVLDVSETATYYGLDGSVIGSMPLKETAIISDDGADTLYGVGSFTPVSGAKRAVQLGCFCVLSAAGTGQCAGGIAQDFPELGMAIGAVTPMFIRFDPNSARSPMTFTGGGTVVTGPIGSLTLSNPQPTSLVIQGGTDFATTTASGGAGSFSLFPPMPTSWTLTDSLHDEQLQITLLDEATRNLGISITLISSGVTLASGTLDQSGTGKITWPDGTSTPIANWTLTAQQ